MTTQQDDAYLEALRARRAQREAAAQRQTRTQQDAEPAKPAESKPKAAPKSKATWALGITLLAFGGIGWLFGGSFTLDGWISWINSVLAIVRLPLAIPEAQGLWRLLFIPLAFVYSRVETKHRPVWRDKQGQWHFETPIFWVGFLLITLTDIGSTAVGLQNTDPAAWGVLEPTVNWIIASGGRVGSVATVLTFAPEWLILSGIWLLKR